MEVTCENFDEVFKSIEKSLQRTEFISIDGEFTGLSTLKQYGVSYDTLEEKYTKLKVGSSKFMLIQYGICLFFWNDETQNYEAEPYTFYIFPRPYKKHNNDVMFMCQSSSLGFLSSNHFDFNKLFHSGISFLNPHDEAKSREKLVKEIAFISNKLSREPAPSTELNTEALTNSKVFVPKDQKEFVQEVVSDVGAFMDDERRSELNLPVCSAFQRKLLYETLEERYPTGLYLKSCMNDDNQKIIKCVKIASKDETLRKRTEEEREIYDKVVGFTKLMKLLTASQIPIVGHNMLMDLFLTVANFYAFPPNKLSEFKLLAQSVFPHVYDTKLMCSVKPLSNCVSGTSLAKLKLSVDDGKLPSHNVAVSEEFRGFLDNSNYHQAGYDAYVTGVSFLSLVRGLAQLLDKTTNKVDFESTLLRPFANRVFVMGIKDINYLDLNKQDEMPPSREGVFYVSHPKGWMSRDLEDVFSPYAHINGYINRISDTETFVTLMDPTKSTVVTENMVLTKNPVITVQNYVDYYNSRYPLNETYKQKDDRKRKADSETSLHESDKTNPAKTLKSNDKISQKPAASKKKRVSSDVEDGELSDDSSEGEEGLFKQCNEW